MGCGDNAGVRPKVNGDSQAIRSDAAGADEPIGVIAAQHLAYPQGVFLTARQMNILQFLGLIHLDDQ
jgi:hypothetical protein